MGNKKKTVTLKCGVTITTWVYSNFEWFDISLINLYSGYGELNDPLLLSKLFAELAELGYKLNGLSREVGYYDSTDDLILSGSKKIK